MLTMQSSFSVTVPWVLMGGGHMQWLPPKVPRVTLTSLTPSLCRPRGGDGQDGLALLGLFTSSSFFKILR